MQSALAEAANRERVRHMLLTAPSVDADGSGSLRQMQPVAIPPDLGSSPHMPQPHVMTTHLMAPPHAAAAARRHDELRGPRRSRRSWPRRSSRSASPRAADRRVRCVFGALFVSLAMAAGGGFMILRCAQAVSAAQGVGVAAGGRVTHCRCAAGACAEHAGRTGGANAMPNVDMSQVEYAAVMAPRSAVSRGAGRCGSADDATTR